MNERYLSKAKRVDNGEWVTGWFLQDCYISPLVKNVGMVQEEYGHIYSTMIIQIDPETLCQCTGLKDKNGVLIFENDKVKAKNWCLDKWYEKVVELDKHRFNLKYWFDDNAFNPWDFWDEHDSSDIEVIGNRHDKEKPHG